MTLRYASALLLVAIAFVPLRGAAQEPVGLDLGGQIVANGEAERYLRVLQLVGRVPAHPVGIRPWNRHEARLLRPPEPHPWQARFADRDTSAARGLAWRLLRPGIATVFNSGAPQGEGEGPVWLGRGFNIHGSAGIRATIGVLDLQLAPVAFWSQNAAYELAPNGLVGNGALRDARFPSRIDSPQRFGTDSYARVDPGYSRIGIDSRFISIGVSTSPLAWGPARNEPLVMGPNAGGFPHVFMGTGAPARLWVGRLHAKVVTGRLEQSPWSPVTEGDKSRLATGLVLTFEPRGLAGLEVGAIRFEHRVLTPGAVTPDALIRPFTSIFSDRADGINSAAENGYASAFARWAIAPAGLEIYAEYGREDYAGDLRTLIQKPDDLGNLLLGFQRVFATGPARLMVFRGELVNAELSSNERGQRGFRAPIPPYLHGTVRQGHTLRGQFLGSATAYGGAGWSVALDRYVPAARTSLTLDRRLVRDYLATQRDSISRRPQIWYSAGAEHFTNHARWGELGVQGSATLELNQNTVARRDRILLRAGASWRGR